jgi:hypothetical protein
LRRIERLQLQQERERQAEQGDGIGLETQVPESLQIPTKLVHLGHGQYEARADLEDEFFGFDPHESDRMRRSYREPGQSQSPWARVWGRVDITAERFGRLATTRCGCSTCRTASDDAASAELLIWCEPSVPLQRSPKRWAAELPPEPYPCQVQVMRRAELPPPMPDEADNYQHLCWRPRRGSLSAHHVWYAMAIRGAPKSARANLRFPKGHGPWGTPPTGEPVKFRTFPTLPKVEIKLLPWATKKPIPKAEQRAEFEHLLAAFFKDDGDPRRHRYIQMCPAETTTRMIGARKNKKPVGCPPIYGKAMDDAARKAKERAEKRGTPFDLEQYLAKRSERRDRGKLKRRDLRILETRSDVNVVADRTGLDHLGQQVARTVDRPSASATKR